MAAAALSAAAAFVVTGCSAAPTHVAAAHMPPATTPTTSPTVTTTAGTATTSAKPATPKPKASPAPECPLPVEGFDCDFQRRIAAVQKYLATRPGTTGVVLHDLRTGATWHNDHAADPTWTASTIKLAMVVDLFTRDHAGEITLTADDRALIQSMLHSSDDNAADTLWFRYAGDDHMAYNDNFATYGLTSLQPQRGYTEFYPYWGFQKCTPEDLDRLIHYVLTQLPAADRTYILDQMRTVAPNQQWGVWGAGPAATPGNKNGWSEEDGGWVMNSVGFVGPGQRFTLAEMNNLRGEGDYDTGRETVTHVAELLFKNRF
jgi:hypothetical protein